MLKAILYGAVLCAVLAARLDGAERGIVSSGHPLATDAGLEVLKRGGNAVDAAVAVGLALGVVDPGNSGLGGGCFILIRLANGGVVAIDGRETAPARATPGMFVRDGKPDTVLSQTGALASGVPGALAAYDFARRNYGSMSLKELAAPAITYAANGFRVDAGLARAIASTATDLRKFPGTAAFVPTGRPLKVGETLRQPDLARSYSRIAEEGPEWFYERDYAQAVQNWMEENGGVMAAQDFKSFRVVTREPIRSQYREFTIFGFPPPSSGGVHVAQILNILENFPLRKLETAERFHVVAEAMKLAFADRARWLGDPAFTDVPKALMSKEYARALASRIDLQQVAAVSGPGAPQVFSSDVFLRHTTHFCTADDEGNWVACTATINTTFGSKVIVPGTGIFLNNQMDDFALAAGTANYFGLVGSEANAVAAGKRPLSSMSPTIVIKDGQPVYALGGAGGPKIISQVVVELVALLDTRATLREALAGPRVHHQWQPDELVVDRSLAADVARRLETLGHRVKTSGTMGISHAIGQTVGGEFLGVADPRGHGKAASVSTGRATRQSR